MPPDSRFFPSKGQYSAEDLAALCGADVVRNGRQKRRFENISDLGSARASDVSFLDNKRYSGQLTKTGAGCCIVRREDVDQVPESAAVLWSENPYLSYARVAAVFHPHWDMTYCPLSGDERVHPTARIGLGTSIGLGAIIGPDAVIGSNCSIEVNSYIGNGVQIGDNTHIGPNASVRFSIIGNNVRIYSGARIGEPGFGFAASEAGPVSVPQVGRVLIGDNVEIGANTTIDRGAVPDTVIGEGTRIDNLVQIGHNVEIGRMCIIVAQVGIAGSTRLGDGVQIGGQVAISGHLVIGDGARVAGGSGVMRDVGPGETVGGLPALPIRQWFRQTAVLSRLAQKRKD